MNEIIINMLKRANNLACNGHLVAAARVRQAAKELTHAT